MAKKPSFSHLYCPRKSCEAENLGEKALILPKVYPTIPLLPLGNSIFRIAASVQSHLTEIKVLYPYSPDFSRRTDRSNVASSPCSLVSDRTDAAILAVRRFWGHRNCEYKYGSGVGASQTARHTHIITGAAELCALCPSETMVGRSRARLSYRILQPTTFFCCHLPLKMWLSSLVCHWLI
jgi:hypothetical protein